MNKQTINIKKHVHLLLDKKLLEKQIKINLKEI